MSDFAPVGVPYIIIGGIFIIVQIIYLIYFNGRISGISLLLAKCGNKLVVDLCSILIITIIMGLPFLIYFISAIHLAGTKNFEGIYSLMIASVHFLGLWLLQWKMRRWRLPLMISVYGAIGTFGTYLLVSINLGYFYSYSGVTAVFLSLSLIAAGRINHEVDMLKNRVDFSRYGQTMYTSLDNHDPLKITSDAYNSTKTRSYRIIVIFCIIYFIIMIMYGVTISLQEDEDKFKGLGWMNFLLVVVIDFIILSKFLNKQIILGIEYSPNSESMHPIKVTIVMGISRLCIVFFKSHWILMHGSALLIIGMIVIQRAIWILIVVPNNSIVKKEKHENYFERVKKIPVMEDDLKNEDKLRIPEMKRQNTNFSLTYCLKELAPLGFLILFYIIYGIILWSVKRFKYAYARPLNTGSNEYKQGIYFPLGWAILISYSLILVWYRLFQKNKFEMKLSLYIYAAVAYLVILITAIIYSVTVFNNNSKGTQILVTCGFLAGALYAFTILMFFGYWSSNGYVFYERHKFKIKGYNEIQKQRTRQRQDSQAHQINRGGLVEEEKQENQMTRTARYEEDKYENQLEGGSSEDEEDLDQESNENEEEAEQEDSEERSAFDDDDEFEHRRAETAALPGIPKSPDDSLNNSKEQENVGDSPGAEEAPLVDILKENIFQMMRPMTKKDLTIVLIFWFNMIGLFIFFIVTVSVFRPTFVNFAIYFWELIIELYLLSFFKYYNKHYNFQDKWVIIPFIICGVLYVASFIMFIVAASNESDKDHRDAIVVVMLIGHLVIVPIVLTFCGVFMKYRYGQVKVEKTEGISGPLFLILLFGIAFFFVLGIVLMAAFESYAAGSGSFLISTLIILYLILEIKLIKKYIDSPRKRQIVLFVVTLTLAAILIIILAATLDGEKAAFDIISFIMYILIAYFAWRFYSEYRKNKKAMKNQIYIYSHKLMPMLKFESSGSGALGQMVENNLEYYFFFITSTLFLLWSLLAALLLKQESKYIAFSFSALALFLIYLYIEHRIHQGKSLQYDEGLTIERDQFLELQKQAFAIKNQEKFNIINQEEEEDTMQVVNRHKEWQKLANFLYYKTHSGLMGGSDRVRPQDNFTSEEIKEQADHYRTRQSFREQCEFLFEVYDRLDLEYFNHIKYKAYMKGLIHLKIQHYKEEIIAAVDVKLNEMRNLLSQEFTAEQRRNNRFYAITPSEFLKLSTPEDFRLMGEAYAMYKRFKIEKRNQINNQRDYEEEKGKQRIMLF